MPNEIASYGQLIRALLDDDIASPPDGSAIGRKGEDGFSPTSIFHQRRIDYERIVELIPADASVLDLGCGRGGLLARLQQRDHHHRLIGVKLDEQAVIACVHRGLDVIQADLNKGLRGFGDQQFDCVVLSQTLQAVRDVPGVINEILRVGHIGIVSFPTSPFARCATSWQRTDGHREGTAGFASSGTTHTDVRFLSIADFEEFCRAKSIRIHRRIALNTEDGAEVFQDPNLDADLAIFVISGSTSAA